MVHYTPDQLLKRNRIIQSQKEFIKYLNKYTINKLINLFSGNNPTIIKYIQDERALRGLNDDTITIRSAIYGENKNKSTLEIMLLKNGIDILHLSIHLAVTNLNAKLSGMLHFKKDIFKTAPKIRYENKMLYALISVHQPVNKPKSLEFSIDDGYVTPNMKNTNANNTKLHNELDYMLQPEMDSIITVLNRIFDEKNPEYYIGLPKDMYSIHNKTNTVLENMNSHINHVTRKNKGNMMISHGAVFPYSLLPRKKSNQKSTHSTRKLHKNKNKTKS